MGRWKEAEVRLTDAPCACTQCHTDLTGLGRERDSSRWGWQTPFLVQRVADPDLEEVVWGLCAGSEGHASNVSSPGGGDSGSPSNGGMGRL